MATITRKLCCSAVVACLVGVALAQARAVEPIVVNQNRLPAGSVANGVLTLHLEIRSGAWHPEDDNGPTLYVQAFGETGHPAQIPGPLMRMPEGTNVHVMVTNTLKLKATVYGLNTRPDTAKTGIELAAGESRELSFAAGAPGTYYYWARTSDKLPKVQPVLEDAHLNGAFIVDPPGAVTADRIFVINAMVVPADVLHEKFEVVTINGKSYPYTEPLEYTQGESVRWRVINPSFGEHPMHLHGAFYQVLSLGDFSSDTGYADGERQSVVTQLLRPTHTMMLEWKPPHVGRWLYHCHFHVHIANEVRVPSLRPAAETQSAPPASHEQHAMDAMTDMAGLVLAINVKPASPPAPIEAAGPPPRKLDLVIEPNADKGKTPTFSCSVREGKKLVASEDKSMGPPIIVTRGEPTEITVLNHLDEPTTIHWHGLELDSYYDGVMGGGDGDHITPAIAPGASFVARFTPNRAGTFIYHTHAAGPMQLTGGVYGALIVLEPGESFDPVRDKLLVLGTRDPGFYAERLTLNGAENPAALVLDRGVSYRLRLINMGSELPANFLLGSKEHPARWKALAKDGAILPSRLATTSDASLHIASGETYDFEFQPETTDEIPLQIDNPLSHAKVTTKVVVQEKRAGLSEGARGSH